MSFLPWVLLRYHSYIKERTLVPLSPLFFFRIRHYTQWSNDFFAHSDTVFTYARNDTWAFNIQLSQQTSSIRTSNAGKNKGSEALKRQRLMISFFKWHSSVLCYWTHLKPSLLFHQDSTHFPNCSLKMSWKTSQILVNDISAKETVTFKFSSAGSSCPWEWESKNSWLVSTTSGTEHSLLEEPSQPLHKLWLRPLVSARISQKMQF